MRMMSELAFSAGRILLLLAVVYAVIAVGVKLISPSMLFPRPPLKYELTGDYLQLTAPDGVTSVKLFTSVGTFGSTPISFKR